jgi:hypothetical protein
MAEVVVDQKRAPLPPVDPDVDIPEAVKKRAAAVDAFYAANGQQQLPFPEPPAAQAEQAPAPQAVAEPVPTVPVQPPPADTPPPSAPYPSDWDDLSWKQRYDSMQGRYNASQRTLGEMEEQMRQMGEELLRMQQQPRRQAPPPQARSYITDKDVQNFGPDLIDLTQRSAVQVMEPRLREVADENLNLRRQIAREAKARLDAQVEAAVPNYRDIDQDPRWHDWLRLPDMLSGRIRQTLLNEAIAAANAPRVISFFRGFLNEEAATGHREPAVTPSPAAPPREPVIPLASLAAPGRVRPAGGGDSSLPPEKPFYTRAQISQNYRDKQRGLWAGRDAEWNQLERDMIQAPLEGRVR